MSTMTTHQTLVNTTSTGEQSGPVTVATADGGYVTIWYDNAFGANSVNVRAQYYDADGNKVGNEVLVSTRTVEDYDVMDMPPLTALALSNGKVVISWATNDSANTDGSDTAVVQTVMSTNGTNVSLTSTIVNSTTAGYQSGPVTTETADGGYFTVWYDNAQNWSGTQIRGQLFDANGIKIGGEVLVSSVGIETTDSIDMPPLTAETLSNGKLVVSWQTNDDQNLDGSGNAVAQSVIEINGSSVVVGQTEIINTTTAGHQSGPVTVATADGGYLTVWYDNAQDWSGTAIRGQYFDANGDKLGNEILISNLGIETHDPIDMPPLTAVALTNGNVVVSWQTNDNQRLDGDQSAVAQTIIQTNGLTATVGTTSLINAYTAGYQSAPVVVATADGGYFTAWYDDAISTPAGQIHGQFFDATGKPVGVQLDIGGTNISGNDTNDMPPLEVTALANGKVVVSWQTDSTDNLDGTGTAVAQSIIENPNQLQGDGIVHGTAGNDIINPGFVDVQGDQVDGPDAEFHGITIGDQTLVNSTSSGDQSGPVTVQTANGNYFTVWYDQALGNDAVNVRGQYFDADGNKIGSEVQISPRSIEDWDGMEMPPLDVLALSNGKIVVAFQTDDWDQADGSSTAIVQSVLTAGPTGVSAPTSSFVNTTTAGYQSGPIMVETANGGYLTVWYDNADGGDAGVLRAQMYNGSGVKVGSETQISGVTVDGWDVMDMPPVDLTALSNGKVIVSWVSSDNLRVDGDQTAVMQGVISTNGSSPFVQSTSIVNTTTTGYQSGPVTVETADGGYLTVWYDNAGSVSGTSIRGQYFDVNGSKLGGELLISNVGIETYDPIDMPPLDAVALSNGNVVVTWQTNDDQNLDGDYGAIAQVVVGTNGSTATVGSTKLVNATTVGYQSGPVVVATSDGGYFTAWYDDAVSAQAGQVHGQFFDAAGNKVGYQLNIGTSRVSGSDGTDMPPLTATALADGKVVVSWQTASTLNVDGNGTAVVQAIVQNTTNIVFPYSNDDVIEAGAGDDIIDGGLGNDTIVAGSGDDTILLSSAFGNDSIIGGETGETSGDTLDASGLTNGLTVVLSGAEAGSITDGASLANFKEIEAFKLGSGDDVFNGSASNGPLSVVAGAGDDSLIGGSPADTFAGGQGADTIFGGAGNDLIDVGSGDGVNDIVGLADGDGSDTIVGFEGPIDNGDGTFGSRDQVDVGGLTDANGDPVNAGDVVVSDDGNGNAVLTFPNGESITLIGVAPTQVDSFNELTAIGIPCFAKGTHIETILGPCLIEDLELGEMVETLDDGYQPIRWIGSRTLSAEVLRDNPHLRPIRISAGALGEGLPERDLVVSPQHRMLVRSKIASRMFGQFEVLVAAKQLLELPGFEIIDDGKPCVYFHMLLNSHQIVYAEGAETESLFTGKEALLSIGGDGLKEILEIFPELRELDAENLPSPARNIVKGRFAKSLARRHAKNCMALVG